MSRTIDNAESKRKCLLILDIIGNCALLLYYKYIGFIISNLNYIFQKDYTVKSIILPLGISFFTFQQIMYVVAVYNKEVKTGLADYLTYILYFPKLLMGPINDPKEFIDQINREDVKNIDWNNITSGIKIFCFGLFKKVIIADTFAVAVNWGFDNIQSATAMDMILVTLFYTFEIYFDFSGYSDMAVGISNIINITLPMNFNSPYKAVSIRDFWKRWHMTLTSFLTKYIYIPLGGSKKGKIRTYINTMIVFLVSGLWHGANWTFILWGAIHGLGCVFDRLFEKHEEKLNLVVRWGVTFAVTSVLWLLFRCESITQWHIVLYRILTFQSTEISEGLILAFNLPEISLLFKFLHVETQVDMIRGFNLLVFTIVTFGICLIPQNNYMLLKQKNGWVSLIMSVVAFLWSFLCLSGESVFIYNNF
jgi:D-alanyl-lipoteichoic acid acyltransferase DltB (MBOAT superfamily)